jgi:hypothetical protein
VAVKDDQDAKRYQKPIRSDENNYGLGGEEERLSYEGVEGVNTANLSNFGYALVMRFTHSELVLLLSGINGPLFSEGCFTKTDCQLNKVYQLKMP